MRYGLFLAVCLIGCGGGGGKVPVAGDGSVVADMAARADLAMPPPPPQDMARPAGDLARAGMTGCNGILLCIMDCKGMQGCPKTCEANATMTGQMIYKTYQSCMDKACPGAKMAADAGMPADAGAMGDGGTQVCDDKASVACKMCQMAATAMGGACATALDACKKDLP